MATFSQDMFKVGDSVLHTSGNVYLIVDMGIASTPEEIAHAKATGGMWRTNDYKSFRQVNLQTGACKGPVRSLKPGTYKITVPVAR